MFDRLRLLILGTLAFILFSSGIAAQTGPTVELLAYNKDNQKVTDLTPNDIELKLDGRTVTIETLKLEPKQPPRMILLVDTSYTAMNNRSLLKDLVTAFIDIKPPQVEMAVSTINNVPQFLSPYQKSSDELVSSLQKIKFGGLPALSESILEAVNRFELGYASTTKTTRKVLVTFSDGSDDSSSSAWDQVMKVVRENNYVLYEINHIRAMKAIFDFKFNDKELIRLAEDSGGCAFRVAELGEIVRIAREIYDRETITYHARLGADAQLPSVDRNRVKVRSRRKDVRVELVAVH